MRHGNLTPCPPRLRRASLSNFRITPGRGGKTNSLNPYWKEGDRKTHPGGGRCAQSKPNTAPSRPRTDFTRGYREGENCYLVISEKQKPHPLPPRLRRTSLSNFRLTPGRGGKQTPLIPLGKRETGKRYYLLRR